MLNHTESNRLKVLCYVLPQWPNRNAAMAELHGDLAFRAWGNNAATETIRQWERFPAESITWTLAALAESAAIYAQTTAGERAESYHDGADS